MISRDQAFAAAARVKRAYESDHKPMICDTLLMHTFQLTMELRRLPLEERLPRAKRVVLELMQDVRENVRLTEQLNMKG